jgi:multiple sugar transport system ATP-binding protein
MTLGQRIGVMKDGRLLQIADSMTLYNRPVNRFVAGFIGSPPMNFLEGRVEPGPLRFVHPALELPLDPPAAAKLEPMTGRPVTFGIRPEGIRLAADGFPAAVEVAELMGNEVVLYLKLGTETLVARVPPLAAPRPGDAVRITFDPDRAHFFDAATEAAIN